MSPTAARPRGVPGPHRRTGRGCARYGAPVRGHGVAPPPPAGGGGAGGGGGGGGF
ncbi:hypothetical protein AAHZ94_35125 [Streptomyces sp. HSW2009]|uniref:hypothetical protein n=1 Tax=Streptomyces sp. HSW2009 TaxID=3142890 RepID=UPI0032EE6F91